MVVSQGKHTTTQQQNTFFCANLPHTFGQIPFPVHFSLFLSPVISFIFVVCTFSSPPHALIIISWSIKTFVRFVRFIFGGQKLAQAPPIQTVWQHPHLKPIPLMQRSARARTSALGIMLWLLLLGLQLPLLHPPPPPPPHLPSSSHASKTLAASRP